MNSLWKITLYRVLKYPYNLPFILCSANKKLLDISEDETTGLESKNKSRLKKYPPVDHWRCKYCSYYTQMLK